MTVVLDKLGQERLTWPPNSVVIQVGLGITLKVSLQKAARSLQSHSEAGNMLSSVFPLVGITISVQACQQTPSTLISGPKPQLVLVPMPRITSYFAMCSIFVRKNSRLEMEQYIHTQRMRKQRLSVTMARLQNFNPNIIPCKRSIIMFSFLKQGSTYS